MMNAIISFISTHNIIRKGSNMIFICNHCHYLFEAELKECRCPDCGKLRIRPADASECNKYWRLQAEFHPERQIPKEHQL